MTYKNKGWIGVDLDATVADYSGWRGESQIGFPIHSVVSKIKQLLKEDIYDVKIFTARVSTDIPEEKELVVNSINKWCIEHIGRELEITCVKDYNMVQLWDDRAKQVIPNTGIFVQDMLEDALEVIQQLVDVIKDVDCKTHDNELSHIVEKARNLLAKPTPRGF